MKLKYKINFPLLLSLILFGGCSNSKKTTKDNVFIPEKVVPSGKSLLYQIYGNGLTQPSYLFGTIHIMNENDFNIGSNIEKKLKTADELVMELDLAEVDMQQLAALSILPNDKTIKDYVSEKDFDTIKAFFEDSVGIPALTFEMSYSRMKPIFLEQLINFKYVGENPSSYENTFSDIADNKNIPMSGLETMLEQLTLLEEISLEDQIKHLVFTVKNYADESIIMDQLFGLYHQQDIDGLFNLITKQVEGDEEFESNLIVKRNYKWLPKIEEKMKSKKIFIAVGAGHLGGKDGLIKLLQNKGYIVEPISTE
jgi:uncharacterized protein YbaP (TraB family)